MPPVGHGVAGQEVTHLERVRRPAVPDDLRTTDRLDVAIGAPRVDEGVDDRVELLLRRIPGFEQVVVEVDVVDRLDRRPGVGVGGEEGAPGAGKQVHRLLEELDTGHSGHPVVGEQHRHQIATKLQLAQGVEGVRAGLGAHHPVRIAVVAAEISGDGPRHARIVVNGEQDRLPVGVNVEFAVGFGRHGTIDANREPTELWWSFLGDVPPRGTPAKLLQSRGCWMAMHTTSRSATPSTVFGELLQRKTAA